MIDKEKEKILFECSQKLIKSLDQIIGSEREFNQHLEKLSEETSKGKYENEKASEQHIKNILKLCTKNSTSLSVIQPEIQNFQEYVFYRKKN